MGRKRRYLDATTVMRLNACTIVRKRQTAQKIAKGAAASEIANLPRGKFERYPPRP